MAALLDSRNRVLLQKSSSLATMPKLPPTHRGATQATSGPDSDLGISASLVVHIAGSQASRTRGPNSIANCLVSWFLLPLHRSGHFRNRAELIPAGWLGVGRAPAARPCRCARSPRCLSSSVVCARSLVALERIRDDKQSLTECQFRRSGLL